jgi:hypothetical protein
VLKEAQTLLYNAEPSSVTSPKTRRDEVQDIKRRLNQYHEFKQGHAQIGRRERAIKSGWRHGITGIDNADSENTSVFY